MSTAPYVAVATVLDRIRAWWDSKRDEWAMAGLVVDQVAAGWVPEPAMVGLVEPPVLDAPDEFEESRPSDLNDCSSCGGDGMVQVRDWMLGGGLVEVTCPGCAGTGERGAA